MKRMKIVALVLVLLAAAMQKEMDALYMEFADWLASWEV